MHAFCEQLLEGLLRCGVDEQRLLVATSGGADSVALLLGLVEIAPLRSLELTVAHLNHRLRGAESDADAVWVGELATAFHLTSEIGFLADEAVCPDASGLEENARNARYHFLDQAANKHDSRTIVLAHTADDLTETVLHHLFRGTGMAGLTGIPPVRKLDSGRRIVRPMLNIRRSLVEKFLRDRQQSVRVDSTNSDTRMTRNRLRHVVLPLLREQVNSQVDIAIQRLVEQAVEIDQFFSEIAGRLLHDALQHSERDLCHLSVRPMEEAHRHHVREMFRELWKRQGWPRQAMGFDQWNRLVSILETRETITLPGRIEARFSAANLLVLRRL